MRYTLKRPCAKCPFRSDVPGYLRRARAQEIAEALARGGEFACHETTVPDSDDPESGLTEGPGSKHCAGALIVMEREGQPGQMMRIAERVGEYDPAALDMGAPVVRSLYDFVRHHGEDEADAFEDEEECCNTVGPDCEAPAGILVGGAVLPAERTGELHECPGCGEFVCSACSNEEGKCERCAEYDDVGVAVRSGTGQ